jgi:hypothetical protein
MFLDPNRLFSCRKAQGISSEIVEVGDLSRRKNKFDKAVVGLFSNHDDGQHRRKRSPQAAIGRVPLPTPAVAPAVIGPPAVNHTGSYRGDLLARWVSKRWQSGYRPLGSSVVPKSIRAF